MKVLEFINVSKNFCHNDEVIEVLDEISFNINEGEIVAIVGPSGAGKSTILNLIANLIEPTTGTVNTNGSIGYMFQRDCLFDWRTIYKNITLGLEIKKDNSFDSLKRVDRMLEEYGLDEFKHSFPFQLSGGMRQRAALIRTLAVNPDILLLDEPFAALDYQTKLKVSNDIYNIIKKEYKTTIMVTHDISEAIRYGCPSLRGQLECKSCLPLKCFLPDLSSSHTTENIRQHYICQRKKREF